MRVYPAIDLLDGDIVRLVRGVRADKTVYGRDLAAQLATYKQAGAKLVHIVDLNGAFGDAERQATRIFAAAQDAGVAVQVGGGIRTRELAEHYLQAGCARIVIGTAAVKDPTWVAALCRSHPDRIVIAIDPKGGKVAVDGWLQGSDITPFALAGVAEEWGAAALLYTNVAHDGTSAGPDVANTADLQHAVSIEVIASGGIGNLDDVRALAQAGITSTVIGRALYEKAFTVEQAIAAANGNT